MLRIKKKQMLPNVYCYILFSAAPQYSLNCTRIIKGKIYKHIAKRYD